MRKLKLVLAALAISFASLSATATETEPSNANSALRSKIVSLLGSIAPSSLTLTDGNDIKANVSLMLNNKNQLIVISVDSNNESVDTYVKSKLNYQKIDVKGLKRGEIYKVPLTIKQS
ncbi:MAG: hypothetical protein JKY02_05100 [Flavobacteriaceae bacterium]|nr:hypothetical protein [Flavobacteriaceae bacterium]